MEDNAISFESALKGLEISVEALKSESTTLEEALIRFEEGMQYYEKCKEHLTAANKKIQVYDKVKKELTDYVE
jgi:exodeoxyribonuclease VII small subunit